MLTFEQNFKLNTLEIIYQDKFMVAVNKPYGWLTHKSKIAIDAEHIVLQTLRDQINNKVYPCHRLDRKTSGVLLFGLEPKIHRAMSELFMSGEISKTYYAIVRGYTADEGTIDYPLKNEAGKEQEAETHYSTLQKTEIPLPHGKFSTSRYSLLELKPRTGRMHQLRRHLSHIFHPIIGDRPHGCSKQNRLFKAKFDFTEMLLHAKTLEFIHPITSENIRIEASFSAEFIRMRTTLGLTPD